MIPPMPWDSDFFPVDVDVEDATAFGARFEVPLSDWIAIELLASRQQTEFVEDEGFFGGDVSLLDVDISYYHAGVVLQWGPGQVKPFVVTGLGVGQIRGVQRHKLYRESCTFGELGMGGPARSICRWDNHEDKAH